MPTIEESVAALVVQNNGLVAATQAYSANATQVLTNFRQINYGPLAAAPTVNPFNGEALVIGAEYYDTVLAKRRTYQGSGVWTNTSTNAELVDASDATKGAGGVGYNSALSYANSTIGRAMSDLALVVDQARTIPFELLGGSGDGNYLTGTGFDNAPAFTAARTKGLAGYKIKFATGKQYKTTAEIVVHDNMNWEGDEGYTPIIFAWFASSGKRIFKSPTTGPMINNVSMSGFTVWRTGPNPEHGLLLDNLNGLNADINVRGISTSIGGAFGVSAFYPENRPSINCFVRASLEFGGNFGVQFGNVDGGSIQVPYAVNCFREVIGLEPYALGAFNFVSSAVASNAITLPSHGLTTGWPLMYANQGNTTIVGLENGGTYYFAIIIDANTIKLSASREGAIVGTAIDVSSSFTGTHRFVKCGVLRNVTVLPSQLYIGDSPAAGTTTGAIIAAASSGGYHEGVTICPLTVIERNPTSGSVGVGIYGAHNIEITGGEFTGNKVGGVTANLGGVNTIRDATGFITPSPQIAMRPRARIFGTMCREFQQKGIYVQDGEVQIFNNNMRSTLPGVTGIEITSAAEARGSYARNNDIFCPNGTATVLTRGSFNRNLANVRPANTEFFARRFQRGSDSKLLPTIVGSGPITIGTITSQEGAASTYAGKLLIQVRQNDTTNTNIAVYELNVGKYSNNGTAVLSLKSSDGLIAGSGASWPSFTFSLSGDTLVATQVGSTSLTLQWLFFVEWTRDLQFTFAA